MAINITPALPDLEWTRLEAEGEARLPGGGVRVAQGALEVWSYGTVKIDRASVAGLIAVANSALHDDDPRKITDARISAMRAAAQEADSQALEDFADALAAFLPPASPMDAR